MASQLGYDKYDVFEKQAPNSRSGYPKSIDSLSLQT